MIDLYSWDTPNGLKASIMLEETGLPYCVTVINITQGDQHHPEFRSISPNGKIPAIVDQDANGGPRRVFESGNILIYLAEKAGKLLPKEGEERTEILGWLFFQVGHLGPMVGQWHWFKSAAPVESEISIKRYKEETLHLLEVLNGRLGDVPYLGGNDYSIADIANYTWSKAAVDELKKEEPDAVTNLQPLVDWLHRIGERPAVQVGMQVPSDEQKLAATDEQSSYSKGPAAGGTVLP